MKYFIDEEKAKVRSDYLPHPMTEPNYRLDLRNNSWLGIECLVKTFKRGEDGKIDVGEINELLIENDKIFDV